MFDWLIDWFNDGDEERTHWGHGLWAGLQCLAITIVLGFVLDLVGYGYDAYIAAWFVGATWGIAYYVGREVDQVRTEAKAAGRSFWQQVRAKTDHAWDVYGAALGCGGALLVQLFVRFVLPLVL